jgi:hypothetical protein
MLFPLEGIPVMEYDVTATISPTSRSGHHSDTALVSVEMLVHNTASEPIRFPFLVLATDPGTGAANAQSVEPKVLNGSQPVEIDEVDEGQAAQLAQQRVAAAGGDAQLQEQVGAWAKRALASAERIRRGRTTIHPGASRRIVVQQRLRVLPDAQGNYQFITIAPSPLLTVSTRGRVSVYTLLPYEDEDVRIAVLPELTEQAFSYELARVKQRQIASWFWQNDPILRLGYRYN